MRPDFPNRFQDRRLFLVTGHYGTGKTEFSVNLALALQEAGRKTAIVDLDIVNPYFRSREQKELWRRRNIRLISSSQACSDADVPALPPDIFTAFEDPELTSVFDIGGDPSGARVLARYRPRILSVPHEMFYILNASRPEVSTPERAVAYLRDIELVCGVPVTGLVNNTHLCGETTAGEILRGAALAEAVSAETGIPIICHMAEYRLCGEPSLAGLPLFPIDIYMKKPWER